MWKKLQPPNRPIGSLLYSSGSRAESTANQNLGKTVELDPVPLPWPSSDNYKYKEPVYRVGYIVEKVNFHTRIHNHR